MNSTDFKAKFRSYTPGMLDYASWDIERTLKIWQGCPDSGGYVNKLLAEKDAIADERARRRKPSVCPHCGK